METALPKVQRDEISLDEGDFVIVTPEQQKISFGVPQGPALVPFWYVCILKSTVLDFCIIYADDTHFYIIICVGNQSMDDSQDA